MIEYIGLSAYTATLIVAASAVCGYVWQTLINGAY